MKAIPSCQLTYGCGDGNARAIHVLENKRLGVVLSVYMCKVHMTGPLPALQRLRNLYYRIYTFLWDAGLIYYSPAGTMVSCEGAILAR